MPLQAQQNIPVPDIFNIPHIPLKNTDTLVDLLHMTITVAIKDPNTGIGFPRAMVPLKNPCGANYMWVYFAQYDEKGEAVPTEFLDETKPFTVAASIHGPFGDVIGMLPAFHNLTNVAEHQYTLNEIRRAYNALPFILKQE